jgi:hypothetical protein
MIIRVALLSILLMCSGCLPLQIKGTPHLAGSVIDADTKQPVAGARLHYAEFPKHEAYTGADGRYDFPRIDYWILFPILVDSDGPPHESALTIEAPKYSSTSVLVVASPDRTNQVFYLNHQ